MTILWNPLYLKPKNKQNDLFKILGYKTLWYLFKYLCIYFLPDKNSITLHMLLKFLFCFHHRFNGILSAFPSPKITSCLVLWFPQRFKCVYILPSHHNNICCFFGQKNGAKQYIWHAFDLCRVLRIHLMGSGVEIINDFGHFKFGQNHKTRFYVRKYF